MKFSKHFTLLFTLLFFGSLSCAERIDFKKLTSIDYPLFLKEYQTKEIEIRGFLYQEGGSYLLAPEPNLKSCCLKPGSKEKMAMPVEGVGLAPLVGTKVLLRGRLFIDPNDSSSAIQLLAALPAEDNDGDYVIFFICLLSLILIAWFGFAWFKKRSNSHLKPH